MAVAQSLVELPYAAYLESVPADRLTHDASLTEAHLDGAELDGGAAASVKFIESALTGVVLQDFGLERARFSEVWLSRNRWVGVRVSEAEWLDVSVLDSVLAGVQAY